MSELLVAALLVDFLNVIARLVVALAFSSGLPVAAAPFVDF